MLLDELRSQHPTITFKPGLDFYWSPNDQTVYYLESELADSDASYSLLHELAHALLGHETYGTDLELVIMEREAWAHAQSLSTAHKVDIPEDHIQDCLDTYRDWLVRRAKCPDCQLVGVQSPASKLYSCVNCPGKWKVPKTQQCVVRRLRVN